jgi:DNA-binding HxlR family transcriptional regulator
VNARPDHSSDNCSMARALAVVGERWALLIVREAFYGVHRFGEFKSRLGIASNLLATRLNTLVETGVMERVAYRDPGDRQRWEYRLTERGLDLRPVLIALMQWGDKYLCDPDGPPVIVRHHAGPDEPDCEEPVRVVIECAGGHAPLHTRTLRRTPGPGARTAKPSE